MKYNNRKETILVYRSEKGLIGKLFSSYSHPAILIDKNEKNIKPGFYEVFLSQWKENFIIAKNLIQVFPEVYLNSFSVTSNMYFIRLNPDTSSPSILLELDVQYKLTEKGVVVNYYLEDTLIQKWERWQDDKEYSYSNYIESATLYEKDYPGFTGKEKENCRNLHLKFDEKKQNDLKKILEIMPKSEFPPDTHEVLTETRAVRRSEKVAGFLRSYDEEEDYATWKETKWIAPDGYKFIDWISLTSQCYLEKMYPLLSKDSIRDLYCKMSQEQKWALWKSKNIIKIILINKKGEKVSYYGWKK